ncbi:MAG: transcriptional regulator [Cyanobacteria bacterium P01_F01_bin.143]
MSDLQRYIERRSQRDPEFVEGFESGYADLKIVVMLRQACKKTELTSEEVVNRLDTKKTSDFKTSKMKF